MRFSLRTLLIGLSVVCALSAIVGIGAKAIKPSYGYGIQAKCGRLPADDSSLETWLSAQPGVVRVHVQRENNQVHVIWIMSQDLMRNPPVPDLRPELENLGYTPIISYDRR
ncbi:hypothetical protein [Anatilimnocola floriformis]|uniref:hypothetical protein n=1 Tax=Anatilimnocola floriformis TaxID=2948575 RepID=UPI0020C480B9|nr:hypothetical protein [Anatilimnocola floriformis]